MKKNMSAQESKPAEDLSPATQSSFQAPSDCSKDYLHDPDFKPCPGAKSITGPKHSELHERILLIPPHEREILRKLAFKVERGLAEARWEKTAKPLRQLVPNWPQLLPQFQYSPADWFENGPTAAQQLLLAGKAEIYFEILARLTSKDTRGLLGYHQGEECAFWKALGELLSKAGGGQ
jgi:hypothetical protein